MCLLDPSAAKDLSPEDGKTFDVFLFGGILGMEVPSGVLRPGWKLCADAFAPFEGTVKANWRIGDDPPRGIHLCGINFYVIRHC